VFSVRSKYILNAKVQEKICLAKDLQVYQIFIVQSHNILIHLNWPLSVEKIKKKNLFKKINRYIGKTRTLRVELTLPPRPLNDASAHWNNTINMRNLPISLGNISEHNIDINARPHDKFRIHNGFNKFLLNQPTFWIAKSTKSFVGLSKSTENLSI